MSTTPSVDLATLATLTAGLDSRDPTVQSTAYQKIIGMAEQGIADAMYQASRCFLNGWGVDANSDLGDYWLRRACVASPASAHAQLIFGMQHLLQQRPESRPAMGLAMIEQAARTGLPIAVVKLSEIHEKGCALFGASLKSAYRVLAEAAAVHSDPWITEAYSRFVQRHAPITNLLDS